MVVRIDGHKAGIVLWKRFRGRRQQDRCQGRESCLAVKSRPAKRRLNTKHITALQVCSLSPCFITASVSSVRLPWETGAVRSGGIDSCIWSRAEWFLNR